MCSGASDGRGFVVAVWWWPRRGLLHFQIRFLNVLGWSTSCAEAAVNYDVARGCLRLLILLVRWWFVSLLRVMAMLHLMTSVSRGLT